MSNYIYTQDLATELEELEERQQAAAQGDFAHEDEKAEPLTDEEEARMEALQKLRDEKLNHEALMSDYNPHSFEISPDHERCDYCGQVADHILHI